MNILTSPNLTSLNPTIQAINWKGNSLTITCQSGEVIKFCPVSFFEYMEISKAITPIRSRMFPFFVGCKKFIMGYKVIFFCILSIYFSSKHCKIVCGIPKLHRKERIYGYIAITDFYCHCNSAYHVSRESRIFQTHSINSHPSVRYG